MQLLISKFIVEPNTVELKLKIIAYMQILSINLKISLIILLLHVAGYDLLLLKEELIYYC